MIIMQGRVYMNDKQGYSVKDGKGFINFQLGLPNANSRNTNQQMVFQDCVAFSSAEATSAGHGVAEQINKHFGKAKKDEIQRGKPVVVFGRMQEREYETTEEQIVPIAGKNYRVKFKVKRKSQQLVVDRIQFVPEWDGKDREQTTSTIQGVEGVEEVEAIEGIVEEKTAEPVATDGSVIENDDPFASTDEDPFK